MKDSRHLYRYIALFIAGLAYAFPVAWYWTAKSTIKAHLTWRDAPPPCLMCFYHPTKVEELMLKCMLYAFILSFIAKLFYATFLRELKTPYPKLFSTEYIFTKLPYYQLHALIAAILLLFGFLLLKFAMYLLGRTGMFIASFF